MDRKYFEMSEAAEFLRISPKTIKEWLKSRSPHNFREYCTKIGRRNIITFENMERYFHGLPTVLKTAHGNSQTEVLR